MFLVAALGTWSSTQLLSRLDIAFDLCGFFSFGLFQVVVHLKPQPKTTRIPKVAMLSALLGELSCQLFGKPEIQWHADLSVADDGFVEESLRFVAIRRPPSIEEHPSVPITSARLLEFVRDLVRLANGGLEMLNRSIPVLGRRGGDTGCIHAKFSETV